MPTTSTAGRTAEGPIAAAPGGGVLSLLASPHTDTEALRIALKAIPESSVPGLLDRIAWHRIDGLAHRALGRIGGNATSGWLFSSLKRRAQRCAAATLSQGLALAEVLDALDRRSVPVAVLRGLRAIESIYGDPSLRPFEDHDLLVPWSEFATARAAVIRLGFEEEAEGYFRRGGVFLDLHSDPLGARRRPTRAALFPLHAGPILARALPGRVAGAPALIPEMEDELILMGVHLVKHSFDRLIRTADVAHVLAEHAATIRWDVLVRRAVASRTLGIVGRAAGAAAVLGVPVPAPLRTPNGSALERWLMRRVAALSPLPHTGEILMMLDAPGALARLRFVIDALLPAGETPDVWSRTRLFPRRAVTVTRDTLRQIAERRSVR